MRRTTSSNKYSVYITFAAVVFFSASRALLASAGDIPADRGTDDAKATPDALFYSLPEKALSGDSGRGTASGDKRRIPDDNGPKSNSQYKQMVADIFSAR